MVTQQEARQYVAKELSKGWYKIKVDGKKKKVYWDVYYCPERNVIEIGMRQTQEEILGDVQDIYAIWRQLTRQLFKNYSAVMVYALVDHVCEEAANQDELLNELSQIDWKKRLPKASTYYRFAGGSKIEDD